MIDSRSFRQLMSCFATGITVVTGRDDAGNPIGVTINSLTSVSLDPPLVLFCLGKWAYMHPAFQKVSRFAVNILSAGQEDVSRYFANTRTNPKPKRLWGRPQMDVPLLNGTLGWMVCEKHKTYKGGDHDIILGEVKKLMKRGETADPLLYFHSRYRHLHGE
ncbi:MAG: flavin reductase family protein [Alphaproteobacteria bacterium]|nr:flavin reductase family protein [Alphaproteobacteria bacterium]MBV8549445.1 flavin reductase family protein [Alphaproteobacteria bacterium]